MGKEVEMLMPILESNEKKRREAIVRAAARDFEVGFLLSVFNLEWTLRRMILVFAKCPSVVIRARLNECSGFWRYCQAWNDCVCKFDKQFGAMTEILGVPAYEESKENFITQYLERRHILVHGTKSGIGVATALCGISMLLKVSEKLVEFSFKHRRDLFGRLNPRQCVCCGFTGYHTALFRNDLKVASCPARLADQCPLLGNKETRKAIWRNMRKAVQPVRELVNVKGEVLVDKIYDAAKELGIEKKTSVKKAIRHLQKVIQAGKQEKGSKNEE